MPKNSKENLYKNEQLNVKNKILEILNINQDKNYFTLYDLDNNTEKQNAILALEGDCEKYFACGGWTYFKNKRENKLNERPSLVLAKNILTSLDIELVNTKMSITINDNKKIITSKYVII
jgi:hypothetical protein